MQSRILCLLVLNALAQPPAPPVRPAEVAADGPLLKINVQLVQVDAVVTDSRGRHIADLRPEDFEVLQDGKPRKITHFSFVAENRPLTAARAALPAIRGIAPPAPLKATDVRRTIALVVDDLGLAFDNIDYVKDALRKFVDNQMQPGDLVAIISSGRGAGALQQFTADKRILHAAIKQLRFNFRNRVGIQSFAPITDTRSGKEMMTDGATTKDIESGTSEDQSKALAASIDGERITSERRQEFERNYFTVGTLGAVQYVIRGLRHLPGRKSVVLFSENMSMSQRDSLGMIGRLQRLAEEANRAGVVLYGLDPRGVVVASLTAADDIHDNPRTDNANNLLNLATQRRHDYLDSQTGMAFLAQQTGGLFLSGSNDIPGLLRNAADDQAGFYLIGYKPESDTFGDDLKKTKYHRVQVRVLRSGLRVRTRNGFFGTPDETFDAIPQTKEAQIATALASPFQASGIPVRLTSLLDSSTKTGPSVFTMLHIEASHLQFQDEPDGWHSAALDIVTSTFGDEGRLSERIDRTYRLRLQGERYEQVLKQGFIYTATHPVKKSGAFQFRAVVRDANSQLLGSASEFIEIPDVGKGKFAVSGILMMQATTEALQNLTGTADTQEASQGYADGHAAIRRFRLGQRVTYGYKILNATLNSPSRLPDVETSLAIFRDGKPVFQTAPKPLSSKPGVDPRLILVGGVLQLGKPFEPGEYTLQIAVRDRLAKPGHNISTQSIQFELLPPA